MRWYMSNDGNDIPSQLVEGWFQTAANLEID